MQICYFTTHKYNATNTTQNKSKAAQQLGVNTNEISHFWEDNLLSSLYFFSIKLRGNGVLKLLSPQNLGNFSFKESSKLKREITLKNLDGKFLGWLIKILNF